MLPGGVETHSKTPIRETQIQGLKYIHSYDKGSEIIPDNRLSQDRGFWNHTWQYASLRQGILQSYQAIHLILAYDSGS